MINEALTRKVVKLISTVAIRLPDDVKKSIADMSASETDGRAKELYGCILDNIDKAAVLGRPICQDTGVLQFFIKAGAGFPYLADIEESLREATLRATQSTPLRHNVVESFTEVNTGNNVGTRAPWFEWEITSGSDLELGVYMAGGGCSLPGRSKVLMPLEGYEGIVRFVFDTITEWGVNACPPLIVGVGIGTCSATAAMLSKKALLRPVGSVNPDPKAALLEKEIKEGLDSIGIGPLGLGGAKSVQAVHIESAAHHPATLAVGVNTGCWATRRGLVRFDKDLNAEFISHRGIEI